MTISKRFIGRTRELSLLKQFTEKQSASLIVIRGRRRIGKSTLIKKFAEPYIFYQFEGLAPTRETTAQMQRNTFAQQLARQTGLPEVVADDWIKLFQLLWEKSKQERIVILFDEISWMGSKDPEFLSKIKMAWDNLFSQNPRLILIICGSASSWIEQNILSSTGFVGRISYTLTVEELHLNEIKEFWNNPNISAYEILKVLSIVGGVPKYLEEINPKLPAEDNIKHLCFTPGGFLVEEFNKIFSDLFLRNSDIYKKIVVCLADGMKTMTDIAAAIDFSKSGRLSEYLNELELSGFIHRDYFWSLKTLQQSSICMYRLKDNYLRFYLKYIVPNMSKIQKNDYAFKSLSALPNWNTILGLQFENLVLHNRKQIQGHLGLDSNEVLCDNPYIQRATTQHKGCQIDYMIQARFNTVYICEIKFSDSPIGTGVIDQIEEKINRLKTPKHMSFRPVLIHVNGVTKDLEHSQYFYKIIDFSKLLGV